MRTRVGYAGGTTAAPTYRNIGDHTEAVQVDFDPAVISFDELLERFWSEHNACRTPFSTQYASILFHDGDAQRRAAEASAAEVVQQRGRELTTRVEPLRRFFAAEDYHQQYALRSDRALLEQARRWLPDDAAVRDSTLAAKLNAYCHGDLPLGELRTELATLGVAVVGERRIARLEPLQTRD